MRLNEYDRYFSGDIFEETIEGEYLQGETPPKKYPVGINVVKTMCLAHADAAGGEYDDMPIQWGVRGDMEVEEGDKDAINLLNTILEENNAASLLWELELDRNIYGGGALRIAPELSLFNTGHIRLTRILRDSFFPVWDPEDPDKLLSATTIVTMSPEQAWEKYGYKAKEDVVTRTEVWTQSTYENYLDKNYISTMSGVNPFGVVPFVYIPRYRSNDWWGEALSKDLIPVQDELNGRVADISEAITYNSNPIKWGVNLPRNFNSDNYPVGPNTLWDLGRQLSGLKPEVGMLEASAAVSPGSLDFMRFVYSWMETSGEAPPIAFGKDDGGGQRSGVTLEIRMWPLLKAVRRSRAYMRSGMARTLHIIGRILNQKKFPNVQQRAIKSILTGNIQAKFFPVLPRDQQKIVDEVVKLLSTTPPSISLETAQILLGRGPGEVVRILNMLEEKRYWQNAVQEEQVEQQQENFEAQAEQAKEEKAKPKEGDK